MTAILERRESSSLWARFCEWVTSTENVRLCAINYLDIKLNIMKLLS